MKKYIIILLLLTVLGGCSKSGNVPGPGTNPPPISNPPGPGDIQITAVNITYGYTGDIIKISAKNIGTDVNAVVAKINNIPATIVANSIVSGAGCNIVVPAKCGNGPITLTKAGKTAVGPDFFYIPSATVTTLYGKYNETGFVNGTGTNMRFGMPVSMSFDKDDNLYVVDLGSITAAGSLIRRINSNGQISTFSGGPLNGNTANYNSSWHNGMGDGFNSVNGGNARFNLPSGITISNGPGNQFKLFVTEKSFIRIINEATATGVFAGNLMDTLNSSGPKTGGRHEAHINPFGPAVLFANASDFGSPTLYWLEGGGNMYRIVKQDVNGNISTLADLTATPGNSLTKSQDGNMYMHATVLGKIYKITQPGAVSIWLNNKDSVLNRATGKNELFENVEEGTAHTMAFDKDGNLFLMTENSTYTILLKIFPDKSFIRLNKWIYKTAYADGTNDKASMSLSPLVLRDNGDIYFITSHAIRKMVFE